MRRQDFFLILVEAFAHEPIITFFKAKRKHWHKKGYSKGDFEEGLLNAYKWLYSESRKPDPFRYRLKKPGGEISEGYLFNDYEENTTALRKEGKLTFPFSKTIYLRRESDWKLLWHFNVDKLKELWPHLFIFLNPDIQLGKPIPKPSFSSPYDPASKYDNTIKVPDSVAVMFKNWPIDPEIEKSNQATLPPADESNTAELKDQPVSLTSQGSGETIKNGRVKLIHGKTLSISQLALIKVYEGQVITRANCNEKVKECGQRSGEKLYQWFGFYSYPANRRARPETDRKLREKIKLFESIYPLLSKKAKESAEVDLERLREYGDSEE